MRKIAHYDKKINRMDLLGGDADSFIQNGRAALVSTPKAGAKLGTPRRKDSKEYGCGGANLFNH